MCILRDTLKYHKTPMSKILITRFETIVVNGQPLYHSKIVAAEGIKSIQNRGESIRFYKYKSIFL